MELTFAKNKSDMEEIADLMAKTFVRRSYFDFYEHRMRYQTQDPWFKTEHSRIIREKNRIVSHISIVEKPLRFGPVDVIIAGIGDVCTHPQARGKGYARILMNDALQYMKKHKYPLTMLYGIPNFYHKFGYIESVKDYKLFLKTRKLKTIQGKYQTREMNEEDIPDLLRLYQNNFSDCVLTVARTEQYFRRLIADPKKYFVVIDDRNQLLGYACLWDEMTREFVVNEAATGDHEVTKTLLQGILHQAPKPLPQSIEIRMTPRMPFARQVQHLGSEWRVSTFAEGEGEGMLGIVDLHQLLEQLNLLFSQRLQHSEFYNLSQDLEISTDQQRVQLVIENGEVTHTKIADTGQPGKSFLKANHRYFVRNVAGFWSIDDLLDSTDARVSDDNSRRLLRVLFPETDPFMLPPDYF